MGTRPWKNRALTVMGGALLLTALVAGACGDDDDAADSDPTAEASVTQTTEETATASAEEVPTDEETAEASATGEETTADAAGIEATIESMVSAYNAGDGTAFAAHFTPDGLRAFAQVPPEVPDTDVAAIYAGEGTVGEPQLTLNRISDVEVDGDVATARLDYALGRVLKVDELTFTRDGEQWLVNAYAYAVAQPEVEGELTEVPVTMVDFGYQFDAAALGEGQVTIAAENAGQQLHEIVFLKIDEGVVLQDALMSDGPPEGIEVITAAVAEPGRSTSITFSDELEPGNYAMLCFIPDETEGPEGTPHFAKGMLSEFTIE